MGLLKSLFLAAKSDNRAFNDAKRITRLIEKRLGCNISSSALDLHKAVMYYTDNEELANKVLVKVGYQTKFDRGMAIDYNKVFDTILEELDKIYKN